MRTFRFSAESDREHRLIFQDARAAPPDVPPAVPPAPEAAPAAPAAATVEDPTGAATAAAAAVDAAGAATRAAVDGVPEMVPIPEVTDPSPFADALRLPGSEDASDAIRVSSSKEKVWQRLPDDRLAAVQSSLEARVYGLAIDKSTARNWRKAQRIEVRANEVKARLRAVTDIIDARAAGMPLAQFRQQRQEREQQAEQAQIAAAAARQAAEAARRTAAAPAAAPTSAPSGSPAAGATPEAMAANERLQAAELVLSEAGISDAERATALGDILAATEQQLRAMNADAPRSTEAAGPNVKEQKERLMTEVLTAYHTDPAATVDTVIGNKATALETEEVAQNVRIDACETSLNAATANVSELRTNLRDAPDTDKPAIQQKLDRALLLESGWKSRLRSLNEQLTKLKEEARSDIRMLQSMKNGAEQIVRDANQKIQSVASRLSGGDVSFSNALKTISIAHDGRFGMTMTTTGTENQKKMITTRLDNDARVLKMPPRLLAALAKIETTA